MEYSGEGRGTGLRRQRAEIRMQRLEVRSGAGSFYENRKIAHFFGYENELWLLALGHYQSERHTVDLLYDILHEAHPDLRLVKTELNTNPIRYMTD